nr:acetyl-CoA carboxylase biotin carboxyl carrier protein [candidate division Zixibacteria bacterium]
MNEKMIRKLIKLVEESNIDQLEVNSWGRKVRITRRLPSNNGHSETSALVQTVTNPVSSSLAPISKPSPTVAVVETSPSEDADQNLIPIKSPMVGTFYAAPAPDAPPYIKQGQKIEVGQVVCIVEAMKLMNEIESEVAGRVARVMAENAQPVEFGKVLFLIDPKG